MSFWTDSQQIILVTGPARSGKSEWAETLASQSQKAVIYVATAQDDPQDPEWQARIAQHQCRRPNHWTTVNTPIELAATIQAGTAEQCLLVDSLGTWLANVIDQEESVWQETQTDLLTSLQQSCCHVILVAEETGWGVVPAYPVGRTFRDRLGALTRAVGAIAHPVFLVTGGFVLNLSQLGLRIK
jgi:adenosylcobinamide kinase/adenosylcobinamide-phosphate guanylyltransferase